MPSSTFVPPPAPVMRCATVADLMHPRIVGCSRRTPVRDVAELMLQHRTHSVLVDALPGGEDAGAAPGALLSAVDLCAAVGQDADRLTAGTLATRPAVTVVPEASVAHAVRLMREHEVSHLLVVHPRSGLPVGVVSALDLVRAIAWGPPARGRR